MTELADVLRGSHEPRSRLDFLSADLNTIEQTVGRLVSGSVTSDRLSDIGLTATVRMADEDGSLRAEDVDSRVWPGRVVRCLRGALVDGVAQYQSLITGVIAQPGSGLATGAVTFSINARLSLAKRRFASPTTFDAGTRLRDVIRTILQLGGLGSNDSLYSLNDRLTTLAASVTFDNDEMLGSAVKLAFDYGFDVYEDGAGVVHMEPFVDPTTAEATWDFTDSATLTTAERTIKTLGAVNRQDVYGRDAAGLPISGRAVVNDPSSPLFWSPDNDRPAEDYYSPDINSPTALEAVAQRLLIERASYETQVEARAVPVPMLAARRVVRYGPTAPGQWLLDRVTMPLYHGEMVMLARRTQSFLL